MRSEQEIKNEINRLRTLEKEAIADMEELIDEESYFLEIYIQKANMIQFQRMSLEWVLSEDTK